MTKTYLKFRSVSPYHLSDTLSWMGLCGPLFPKVQILDGKMYQQKAIIRVKEKKNYFQIVEIFLTVITIAYRNIIHIHSQLPTKITDKHGSLMLYIFELARHG
ncbi:MAG: hypothetical protein Ct9H300mP29_4070 [Candidatus Neomarinimicrobiota bacterium]|nr:MAG: hypothetical protein Ct9H300mP29_4070 [Candidatus Neomarinimicrobiota bacterium]